MHLWCCDLARIFANYSRMTININDYSWSINDNSLSKEYCCVVKIPVFRMVLLPFGKVRVGQKNKCFHLFLYVFIGFFFVRTCVRYKKWTF